MPELSPANLTNFLERFYHCYDGLVQDKQVSLAKKHVVVTLSVQDRETSENEGWVTLTLEIKDVVEFTLIEDKSTHAVLSDGIQIGFFDGVFYIDLCPYTEEPNGIDDFEKSCFLIAGKKCTWSTSPYHEVRADTSQEPREYDLPLNHMAISKLGDRIVLDPSVLQPEDAFTPITYREFLEHVKELKEERMRIHEVILSTPKEERSKISEWTQFDDVSKQIRVLVRKYRHRLPIHLLAQCPYCKTRILQPFDSFSLTSLYQDFELTEIYWGGSKWHASSPPQQHCQHVLFTTLFINLNNLKPDDMPTWMFRLSPLMMGALPLDSAPYAIIWPLIARWTSAVIHSLPVGRLDDPEPIHRYTAYVVTYFAHEASNVHSNEMWVWGDRVPATAGVYIDLDLVKWVKVRRLYWLDPEDVDQLIQEPVEAFPYSNIQPQGWYRILASGQVDGPHPYDNSRVWQDDAPGHDETFPKTIE